MKSCILWDHDGVLVDTERWYFEATRDALQPLGIELDLDGYLKDMAVGRSAWERARAAGIDEGRIARFRSLRDADYQRLLVEQDIAIPGVEAALEQLAPHFAMAIVTTAKRADFELIHRDRGIVRHMCFVLASGDYARAKPAPDPYLEALRRFGVPAERAIAVEDSERGLRAALAAGIDCVVVDNAFVRGQDLSAATHRIGSIGELPTLLAGL
jgi:HAD superfamily hydrolase (TIGR01509 family)